MGDSKFVSGRHSKGWKREEEGMDEEADDH
jgi:hypothetical protein